MKTLVAFAVAVLPVLAGDATMSGPVLGVVHDAGIQGLRPVLGLPGAARLGRPIPFGMGLSAATIAPGGRVAIGVGAADGRVWLLNPATGVASPIEGLPASPASMDFSPGGNMAALVYSDCIRWFDVGQGAITAVDTSGLGGAVAVAAISDGGAVALATADGRVFYATRGGEPQPVGNLKRVSAIRFLPDSTDALLADELDDAVYGLRGGMLVRVSAGAVTAPIAVEPAADGRRVLVAGSGNLVVVDLTTGTVTAIECRGTVSRLDRLSDRSAYLLGGGGAEPLWMLDDTAAGPRAFFVPPDSSGTHHRTQRIERPGNGAAR